MQVENINGCSATPYTLPVKVYDNPVAGFSHTPEHALLYEALISFENSSVGGAQYDWDFGDGQSAGFFNGDHMYNDTGTFTITLIVISQNGCRDTVDGIVTVEEGFSFYVPNAFTPNGDGVNDSFQGYGTFLNSYEMRIYDRWGVLIYFTDSYDRPWDGRIHSLAQNDTYVYRINVTDRRNKPHVFIGSVTLVR
jgi:gliding motility-associated-like protein